MLNVIYDPFLTRKTPFFTRFILSGASDNTTSQNIGEDQCMGRPPPQILGGTVPQSPLGLRPWRRPRISIVIATFCPLFYCCCPLIFLAKLCKWLGNISQYLICADRYHVAYMYGCQMALSKIMDNGSAGVSGIKY